MRHLSESMSTTAKGERLTPIIRWAGSKRKVLPSLIERAPRSFRTYVEPFSGSACLFFALRPKRAVLGDINEELITTYESLRKHPRLVYRELSSKPRTESYYYALRRELPSELPPIARAARFLYLNRFCFNGVFRTNKMGSFNVPFGKRTGDIPPERTFVRASIRLRNVRLRVGDFETCVSHVKRGDFVYLDPPYATGQSRWRGEYGYNSFTKSDLSRLVACLKRIHRKGAYFLLSYADGAEIKRRFSSLSCRITRLRVRRHVAGFRRHRRLVNELLISNY